MLRYWQELVILILAFVFAGLVSSLLLSLMGVVNYSDSNGVTSYLLSAIVSQVVMFFGAGILFFTITKIPFSSYVTFRAFSATDWWIFVLYLGASVILSFLLSPFINEVAEWYASHPWVIYQTEVSAIQNKVIGSFRGGKIVIALAVFAVLPAIAEELVFRGILYPIFKNTTAKKQLAMWLTAFIFAIVHFQVLSFIPILVVGYFLAAAYERTKNIGVAMLIHFGFNAIQIIFWQA